MAELENRAAVGETSFVLKLREALIAAESHPSEDPLRHEALMRQVDRAAQPLIERCFGPLLQHCDGLARGGGSSSLRNRADGSDIAQDAWAKMLRYLKGEGGERVQSDSHFFRLLRAAATTRFLDLLQATAPASLDESPSLLNQSARLPDADAFSPFGDARAPELIELLFTDEEAFRRGCQRPIRRRLAHYQAFVLYQLGQYLCSEAVINAADGSTDVSSFVVTTLRRYVDALGIPPEIWSAVETVVLFPAGGKLDATSVPLQLIETVNRLLDAGLKPGNNLSVLRHEMNGFLHG